MARRRFIVIYGGTELTDLQRALAADLGVEVVENPDYVLVTGGFKAFEKYPSRISTDWAAASAAENRLKETGVPVDSRIETWLPDETLDRLDDNVDRFEIGTVRRLRGDSDRVRRFKLVHDADAIVTMSGSGNTTIVLDLAEAIEKPALPIPFTGNDSEQHWTQHRESIRRRFRMTDATLASLEQFDLEASSPTDRALVARRIVREILPESLRRGCLVLMPFRAELLSFYEGVLKPAIEEAGFEAIRIDFSTEPGDIYGQFLYHLERCEAFVMDITGGNPNVMYELGHAHARRIEPLLIHRGPLAESPATRLPFYLLPQRVETFREELATDCERLTDRIVSHLRQIGK